MNWEVGFCVTGPILTQVMQNISYSSSARLWKIDDE